MLFAASRGRPRHLLAVWGAYWATLAVVKLGTATAAIWRVTRSGSEHGSVSASFDDDLLRLNVISGTTRVWEGATHLGTLAWWVAGPPLLIWLAWLLLAPRRERADHGATHSGIGAGPRPHAALDAPVAEHGVRSRGMGPQAVPEARDRAR